MSSQKGNIKRNRGQAHHNAFGFKHNLLSALTQKVLAAPLDHLCRRCLEQIQWRVAYHKYKPLALARRCNTCKQPGVVIKAYRVICDKCAESKKKEGIMQCTKCCKNVKEKGMGGYARAENAVESKEDKAKFEK